MNSQLNKSVLDCCDRGRRAGPARYIIDIRSFIWVQGPMNTNSGRSTLSLLLEAPILTRARVRTAYAVAVATDALQLVLGPVGWALVDETLDVMAAFAMWRLLGFHPLLLPTFIVEFLPVTDLLPTWTGCVALVVALRKRQQMSTTPPAPGSVIDV